MCHSDGGPQNQPLLEDCLIPLSSGEEMPGWRARAHPHSRGKVVLVVDIYGRSQFYGGLAHDLAAEGYDTLVPEIFFRQGPLADSSFEAAAKRKGQQDESVTLRDLSEAIEWHVGPETPPGTARAGVVGFCLGGTFALDLAAMVSDLAVVCFYGFPAGTQPAGPLTATPPLDRVDAMKGAILGLWGEDDEKVGREPVAKLIAALHSRPLEFESKVYPGAGHSFLASRDDPSRAEHSAATDAWSRAVEFLSRHLVAD